MGLLVRWVGWVQRVDGQPYSSWVGLFIVGHGVYGGFGFVRVCVVGWFGSMVSGGVGLCR